jgi:hypothetical protein
LRSKLVDHLVVTAGDPLGAGARAIFGLLVRFHGRAADGAGVKERAFVVPEENDAKNCCLGVFLQDSFSCGQGFGLEVVGQCLRIAATPKRLRCEVRKINPGFRVDELVARDNEVAVLL